MHKLPTDLGKALIADCTALDGWKDTTPLVAHNEFICWVEDAEQDRTRERRHGRLPGVCAGPNRQVAFPTDWRAYGRAPATFGFLEPNLSDLENRCASYWRTESSNLSPSVLGRSPR